MAKLKFNAEESSFINWVEWDSTTGELKVNLRTNTTYTHKDVGERAFLAFANAESAGTYYNKEIKPNFPHTPSKAELKRNEEAFALLKEYIDWYDDDKNLGVNPLTMQKDKVREIVNRPV